MCFGQPPSSEIILSFYERLLKSKQSGKLKQNPKYKVENCRTVVTYKLYTSIFQHSCVVIDTEDVSYFMFFAEIQGSGRET